MIREANRVRNVPQIATARANCSNGRSVAGIRDGVAKAINGVRKKTRK